MNADDSVLDITGLIVEYGRGENPVRAVNGVDLTLRRGEVLGLAGESGSGKSTLAYAVSRLLRPPGRTVAGRVLFRPPGPGAAPVDVLTMSPQQLRRFRWAELSVVFQAAMSSLNPVLSVADQLVDGIRAHRGSLTARQGRTKAAELLELVGIDPSRLSAYPHQLSGGMRQRVMIAMALALEPEVIVMDEPTTALDVVVQREILTRIMDLRERMGCSIIFITHDLSLLAEISDRVAIMYAGRIVELGDVADVIDSPEHPYTRGLLGSFPSLRGPRRELVGIPGAPPDPRALPAGCPFHPRCPEAVDGCREVEPALIRIGRRQVACIVRQSEISAVGALRRETPQNAEATS